MKILIIGGSGFLGSPLTRNLTTLGHDLTIYHRGTLPSDLPPTVHHLHAQLSDMHHHRQTLRNEKFDLIIHLLAANRFEASLAVEIFSNHAGRLLLASSHDVYAAFGALLRKESRDPSNHPLNESSPLRTSRYLRGNEYEKIEVEEIFQAASAKLPLTILRLPITYGPHDPRHEFFSPLKRIADKRPAILLDPDYGNFKSAHAYVDNIAHAFTLAATNPLATNRIYNIGESAAHKTLTIAERLHMLASAAKYRGKIIVLPKDICPPHLTKNLDFRHDLIIDDSAIRKDLGYAEIVLLNEGFRRTVDWQKNICPLHLNPAEYNYPAEDAILAEYGLLPKK